MSKPYLTPDQVFALNEKHGWFQYGDAQSDVSRAFAQDAIAAHERIRASAPTLLEALTLAASKPLAQHCTDEEWEFIRSAIMGAQGEQP